MKSGKVSEAVLKRSVIKAVNSAQTEAKAGVGKDAGLFGVPKHTEQIAAACAAVAGNEQGLAELAIVRACNSLAAAGTTPLAVTAQLVLPEGTEEIKLKESMSELLAACKRANVTLMSGHTQIDNTTKRVISVTAMGAVAERPVAETNESDNIDLVMTGYAGMAGTALLARAYREELHTKYTYALIDRAIAFREQLLVLSEAKLLAEHGITRMHDVAEGGIFGAVWELCEKNQMGVELDLKKIPIHQETIEISEFFDINPYQLRGDGSLLCFTNQSATIIEALRKQGITATVIGRATKGNDRVIKNEDELRFLEPNRVDDYYQVVAKNEKQ